jgi:hypothetical protein
MSLFLGLSAIWSRRRGYLTTRVRLLLYAVLPGSAAAQGDWGGSGLFDSLVSLAAFLADRLGVLMPA